MLNKLLLQLTCLLFATCSHNLPTPVVPTQSYLASPYPTLTPTPAPNTVSIGLLGDLGLGRNITYTAREKNDFYYSFSGMDSWLLQNDLNSANLESPIVKSCPSIKANTFKFCGDTAFISPLKSYKIFANLANNHILNYGREGLEETEKLLLENQIKYVYSHKSNTKFTQVNINDISLGFLGYDLTGSQTKPTDLELIADVKTYASKIDWLVVHLHWGNEYLPAPEAWKVNLAHQLITAGADIIQGTHPHVWQGEEVYQDRLIYYSLGNFIFDQNWSLPTSQSYAIRLTLSKNKILKTEKQAYQINNNSRPVPIESLTAYPFKKADIL